MQQQQPGQEETALNIGHESLSAHHRKARQAYFESVLAKARQGSDPFAAEPLQRGGSTATAAVEALHPDVAAFGAALERHKTLLLAAALIVSQAFSWVLMKGALNSMHTPGVLAFLHMVTAALMQLVLASWHILEQPQISAKAAKGSLVQATLTGLQVLLVSSFMLHGSVYMLLCWVTVLPLLISYTCCLTTGYAKTKASNMHLPQEQRIALAAACLGLCIELVSDHHLATLPLLLMCGWGMTTVLQQIWQQLKVDATLGHSIMDPEFLFRVRELSDLEDGSSSSTICFMASSLPVLPSLIIGLVCLEGQDLVEHEPSVPTLSVLLLSCLLFAATTSLRVVLANHFQQLPELRGMLTSAAALLAVLLDFMESAHEHGWLCLLGVSVAIAGSLMSHFLRWKATKEPQVHAL